MPSGTYIAQLPPYPTTTHKRPGRLYLHIVMPSVSKIEISGSKPVDIAIDFLKRREGHIDSITIEMEELEDTDTAEKQAESEDTDDEEQSEQAEQSKEIEREPGDIREGTSHHRVLYAISKLDQPVPAKAVEEEVEGVNESSIHPALTQLYQRMMVDRAHVTDVANPYHEYEITDYGAEKLDELGEPEPVEE